jgi:hypothetical protein
MGQPIQIILMKQLAGYLSIPLFLVGPNGDLLFYNEPAEALLGRRFDETGAMSAKEWSSAFTPEDSEGHPVPPEDVPLMITITKKRPAYQRFFIRGLRVSADTSRSRQFRLLGWMATSWVGRPYFGKFRIDACHAFWHSRIARCTGSGDEPIRWQYVRR